MITMRPMTHLGTPPDPVHPGQHWAGQVQLQLSPNRHRRCILCAHLPMRGTSDERLP
ncbi:unnamed protein product [Mycena citricolor]|uniref:Uncharacterized protein n=1 Tax=Mycena citricolor TaxID=2018698 RepID=A0AAD2HHS5_9AGAR|nr:unnamed protein product [Mycena citricolor]